MRINAMMPASRAPRHGGATAESSRVVGYIGGCSSWMVLENTAMDIRTSRMLVDRENRSSINARTAVGPMSLPTPSGRNFPVCASTPCSPAETTRPMSPTMTVFPGNVPRRWMRVSKKSRSRLAKYHGPSSGEGGCEGRLPQRRRIRRPCRAAPAT